MARPVVSPAVEQERGSGPMLRCVFMCRLCFDSLKKNNFLPRRNPEPCKPLRPSLSALSVKLLPVSGHISSSWSYLCFGSSVVMMQFLPRGERLRVISSKQRKPSTPRGDEGFLINTNWKIETFLSNICSDFYHWVFCDLWPSTCWPLGLLTCW